MTEEIDMTVTYRAMGMTDDVTTCEICGKPELKGTVRLIVLDAAGEMDGEIYAGVTCAARRVGRRASDIRREATTADRQRYQAELDAFNAWDFTHVVWKNRAIEAAGLRWARPAELRAFFESPGFKAQEAEFLAAHPPVPRPTR